MSVNLSLFAGAGWQFFTDNGVPLSGGLLYTYAAGTTTPETTYTDNTGTTQNANPIVLDAAGRPPYEIWLTTNTTYKFVIKTSTNTLIGTYDNIPGANDASYVFTDLANTTDVAKGDALIGFKQSNSSGVLTGAVGKTVHDKLQEIVSVKDFGAVGDGVADDTSAIQAAIDAVSRGVLVFPQGTYNTSATINIASKNAQNDATQSNLEILAYGAKIVSTVSGSTAALYINGCKRLIISGLEVSAASTTLTQLGRIQARSREQQFAERIRSAIEIAGRHG